LLFHHAGSFDALYYPKRLVRLSVKQSFANIVSRLVLEQ